jgi:flagellar hook-length control protein FliK
MNSTMIRPAQLMMEYMASEQEKMGQGISSQEFSKHLEEQHVKTIRQQNLLPEVLVRPQRHTVVQNQTHKASRKDRAPKNSGAQDGKDLDDRQSKVRKERTLPPEAMPTQQWRKAQQLRFSDPMALEKVLGELQLSPDLRESLQSNSLLNGSVSLQQLSVVLDQALQAQGKVATDGKVGASEVRGLLASLQSAQNGPPGASDLVQLKSAGFYNLAEFRQLLQQIVEQSAHSQTPQNPVNVVENSGGVPSTTQSSTSAPPGNATGKLTSQPESAGIFLARSLLDNGAAGSGNSNLTASAHNAPASANTAPGLLAHLGQAGTADAEAVAPYGQPQNPTGMVTSATHTGAPNMTLPSDPRLAAGTPQGMVTVNNDNSLNHPGLRPVISQEGASAGPGVTLPAALGLFKNLEGNAEAVLRSFHLEPEAQRSGTSQNLTAESALNKSLVGDITEKIAGPEQTSAQSTDHQEDQQNLFSFTRQGIPVATSGGSPVIGHNAGTPLTSPSSWAQALAERISEMQQNKQHQLTLEVDSKDLGRVLLHVETEDNQVRATISTDSEQMREMLHRSAPQLRQQLESQGLVLGQLLIDVQDQKGGRHHLPHRSAQRSKDMATGRATATAPGQWIAPGAASALGTPDQIINVFA